MGSTNKTAHYELPQFVANDKPSWLGDVNEAMEAIDTGIYGAKSSADGAQQTANNAVAGVASAGTRMDGIQTQLDTVATQANQTATTVTGHTSSIATNSANINTLNSRMGSTDISAIGDGTVTGAIEAISEGGGGGASGLEVVESGNAAITNGSGTYGHAINVTGYKVLFIEIVSANGVLALLSVDGYGTVVPRVSTGAGSPVAFYVNFSTGAVTVIDSANQIISVSKIYGLK